MNVKVKIEIQGDDVNVDLPSTLIKDTLFGSEPRAIYHFIKIDPAKSWGGEFTLQVETSGKMNSYYTN